MIKNEERMLRIVINIYLYFDQIKFEKVGYLVNYKFIVYLRNNTYMKKKKYF